MNVPISESTASTPAPTAKPFPPQTQFVHIVVTDKTTGECGLIDYRGEATFRSYKADEVIQKAIERSVGKGPILIMNGDYIFDSINAHDISICGTGANNTVLAGEIKCSNSTFSNLTFSAQKWSEPGQFSIRECDIPSLEVNGKGAIGRISDSFINSLTLNGSNMFITRNKIGNLKMNGRRFVLSENIIESGDIDVSESVTSNNVIGNVAGHPIDKRSTVLKSLYKHTRTKNIPITSASGGICFPKLEVDSVTIFVPHVTFERQIGEPTFYIGESGGAPYFDPKTYPQSLGYPLTSPHQKIEYTNINLNQIRAVSSISGAFLAYHAIV